MVACTMRLFTNILGFQTITPPGVGNTGVFYIAAFTISYGNPPLSVIIPNGSLPPGLTAGMVPNTPYLNIQGTPTQTGTFPFTLRVTDSRNLSAAVELSITITGGGTIRLTTDSLPRATSSQPYSTNLLAAGGVPPYRFALAGGGLPPGLTLSTDGAITGTPTLTGNYTINVQITDSRGSVGSGSATLEISDDRFRFFTTTLLVGRVGQPYRDIIRMRGGIFPYRCSTDQSALPSGIRFVNEEPPISLNVLIGEPTRVQTATFQMRCRDLGNTLIEAPFTLMIAGGGLQLSSTMPKRAFVGQPYRVQLTAENGRPPYVFFYRPSPPDPPDELYINPQGVVTGTPTVERTWTRDLRILDDQPDGTNATVTFRVVRPTLRLEQSTLPAAGVGQAYRQTLRATGGTAPFEFEATGALPPNLTLSRTGELAGTITRAGTYAIPVRVKDAEDQLGSGNLMLEVGASALRMDSATLPNGRLGQNFTFRFNGSGGAPPYSFQLRSGAVPGLTLDPAGEMRGIPTLAGTFPLEVTVRDSTGATVTTNFRLVVEADSSLAISALAPSEALVRHAYDFGFSANGGRAPIDWQVLGGTLPAGIRMSSSGELSGTALTPGSFTFMVQARDVEGRLAQREFAIAVRPAEGMETARQGVRYQARFAPPDGGRWRNFRLAARVFGRLPAGLELREDGTVEGVPTVAGASVFGVIAENERNQTVRSAVALAVLPALSGLRIETLQAGAYSPGVARTIQLEAQGGEPPYAWSISSGALPNGLALREDRIEGTALSTGQSSFTLTVRDQNGDSASAALDLVVGDLNRPVVEFAGSAASYDGGALAPGELITLFGKNLSGTGLSAPGPTGGVYGKVIDGARVWFDQTAAALLYTSPGQVGAIAPFSLIPGQVVHVAVERDGFRGAPTILAVVPAKPGVFTVDGSGSGPAAALNQDGTVNREAGPAAKGSVVVLYLTGLGATEPAGSDGAIAGAVQRAVMVPSVMIDGKAAELLYAGTAPGLVHGVSQLNVRIPEGVAAGFRSVQVLAGGAQPRGGVGIWVE
jgi:uncharacterized protein (TIGR03437 family)